MSFLTEAVSDGAPSPTFADGTLEQVKEDAAAQEEDTADDDRSARRKNLVSQAEERAQHQALARLTMLDLARELEEAAEARRSLERELMQERKHSDLLREKAEKAEAKTRQAEEKLEDAKVELYRHRFKDGLFKGGLTSTMLLWSQEAVPLDALGQNPSQPSSPSNPSGLAEEDGDEEGDDYDEDELSALSEGEEGEEDEAGEPEDTGSAASRETTGARPQDTSSGGGAEASKGPTKRPKDDEAGAEGGEAAPKRTRKAGSSPSDGEASSGDRRKSRPLLGRKKSSLGRSLAKTGERSKGDGVMLLWIFRAFKGFSQEARRHRLEAEGKAEAEAAKAQELDKMKASYEKLLAEERAKVRALDARVKGLIEEIEKWKFKVEALEREKAELLKQLKPSAADDLGFDELKRKYEEAIALIEHKDREIAELKQMVRDLENKLINQREAFEEDVKKLKAQIRELSAELQRQILFAKHLRDLALKAKRDAASSISPEKFAQLISEMELMRDKLVVLGSDHDREAQQSNLLRMKLDQNKRRLELERQFLPLLHKVRGPVGPKNPLFNKNMTAMAAASMVPDELGAPQDRLRMAHSQSSPALEGHGRGSGRQDGGGRHGGGHRLGGIG